MMVMSWAPRGCLLRRDASTFRFGRRTRPYVEPSRLSSMHGTSSLFACAIACTQYAVSWSSKVWAASHEEGVIFADYTMQVML